MLMTLFLKPAFLKSEPEIKYYQDITPHNISDFYEFFQILIISILIMNIFARITNAINDPLRKAFF